MRFNKLKSTLLLFVLIIISCGNTTGKTSTPSKDKLVENSLSKKTTIPIVGANRTKVLLPLIKDKKVAIVANQTSVIFKNEAQTLYTHIVDSLLQLDVQIKKVFAPEHGFRGKADAGEHVKDGIDKKTGIPIISLYGKNKKPNAANLKDIEVILFDIQDVGARFYTYISSLHYVMEAAAENNIPVIILDRPNPNGHYIDGPILESTYQSFVGMHPVPIVHGMTIGEYGKMVNNEGWLANSITCDLTIINCENYNRNNSYSLPIKPSPNLPNDIAINLYPSLCFFEGTNVNAGRGTDLQFQIYGSPFLKNMTFEYTPKSNEGAKYPKHENKLCFGENLTQTPKLAHINLDWLIKAYQQTADQDKFFNMFFVKLAGTKKLQQQIASGLSAQDIRATWQPGLDQFKKLRSKYLIYD